MAPLILLVDDFDDARDMYREYLQFRGLRVITADGGRQSVDLAKHHRPDLILMDLRMPGVSGFDALKELRADDSLNGIPVVALTAQAMDDERRLVLRAGFDQMVSKPCLPDELFRIIAELLSQWRPDLAPL